MLGFPTSDDYCRVRDVFDRSDYCYDAISQTLDEAEWLTQRAIDLPRFERHVEEPTPHNTLIRLFLLGGEVSAEHVRQALQPMTLQEWIEAGLVLPPTSDDRVRSAVRITPVQDLLLFLC